LEKQIQWKYFSSVCPVAKPTKNQKQISWTGSQVKLVELVYALKECGCINNGAETLKSMFLGVCSFFNIKITDYYRFFDDMIHRVGDRTIFLNKLKKCLMAKMEAIDKKTSRQ
jgi:hypothetical protein